VTVASKGGLGTGESLQVLCVLGTGEGLTGCDGGPCLVSVYQGPETQVLIAKYRGPETLTFIALRYVKTRRQQQKKRGGINGLKNRSGQWEGLGGVGELDGCIMHPAPTS